MPALNPTALVTLTEARAYVLRDALNSDQDILLTTLINSFSRAIQRYCARQFFPEDAESKLFTYNGQGYLSLEPYELRTITSMAIRSPGLTDEPIDPVGPTNSVGHQLEPQERTTEGTYLWVRMPKVGSPNTYPRSMVTGYLNTVTIVGDWGLTSIPDDATLACLICIDWRYKNPSGGQSVAVGGLVEQGWSRPSSGVSDLFPPEAMGYLDLLRRPDHGV